MKLYRFMSRDEFNKFSKGETLVNNTDHSKKRGTASTAKGFCFGIGDEEQAMKDLRRLCGIVNTEILMVFEPKSIDQFTPCQGRYVDYDKIDEEGKIINDYPLTGEPCRYFDEFCIGKYSIRNIGHVDALKKDVGPVFMINFL